MLNSGEFFDGDWEAGACGKFLSTEDITTFDKEAVCVYVHVCMYILRTLHHGSIAPSSAVGPVPLS